MNGKYEEIARVFIEQYNVTKGTHYEFGCRRKSMFSVPKYQFQNLEICQMAFIEGKKENSIIADLMVMLHLKRRLIMEVIEPRLGQEDTTVPIIRWTESLIDTNRKACSKRGGLLQVSINRW